VAGRVGTAVGRALLGAAVGTAVVTGRVRTAVGRTLARAAVGTAVVTGRVRAAVGGALRAHAGARGDVVVAESHENSLQKHAPASVAGRGGDLDVPRVDHN
jgi:hypothetical protein